MSASPSARPFFKRSVFLMAAMAKLRAPKSWNQSSGNVWITFAILWQAFSMFLLLGWGFIVRVKELCVLP